MSKGILITILVFIFSLSPLYFFCGYSWPSFLRNECSFGKLICWNSVFSIVLTFKTFHSITSVQFSSVTQSCPTLCDPTNHSMPVLPVHHQFPEFTQTHVHRVGDAIQPSHSLSSPSPPASNPSQHQGLSQWVNSSHEVTKVLEFQL